MDVYPGLRTVIKAEFRSIRRFCKEAGLPESTVGALLAGRRGHRAEVIARARVEDALRRLRPDLNQNGVWARQEPNAVSSRDVVLDGRRVRVITTVITEIQDLGPVEAGRKEQQENG